MTRDQITLGFALSAVLLASQARADTMTCLDRATLVERLAGQYGESPQSVGLAGDDRLIELFASPDTGSWTLLVTAPNGIACLYAAGDHFERFEPVPAGDPA